MVELFIDAPDDILEMISTPMRVESISAPPGGDVVINDDPSSSEPLMKMISDDLSTSRAMLNSYLGLVSIAITSAHSR
jgi:hypothetical protein